MWKIVRVLEASIIYIYIYINIYIYIIGKEVSNLVNIIYVGDFWKRKKKKKIIIIIIITMKSSAPAIEDCDWYY